MKKRILFIACSLLLVAVVFAQTNKVNADKIIGIVGNKIVLKSDVQDRLLDMQRQGAEIPVNGKCFILQDLMGTKTLVLQAEKDSLPVTDEEVEGDVENRIRTYLNQFGSKEELEKVAGKTIYQLKEDRKATYRRELPAGHACRFCKSVVTSGAV